MSDPHEPAWYPRKTNRARHTDATGDELEAALWAAERLLIHAYDGQRHDQNIRLASGSLILVLVGSLAGIISFGGGGSFPALVSGMATGVGALIIMLRVASPRRLSQQTYVVHLTLAGDLAGMVDEVLVEVAHREGWSHLRLESYKLRLSAFPLRPLATDNLIQLSRSRERTEHER